MSDNDDEQADSDASMMEGLECMGFGPLIPTESERSLMERVRQELKHELKNVWHYSIRSKQTNQPNLVRLFGAGLQGETSGHQGRNPTQEKSRETPR